MDTHTGPLTGVMIPHDAGGDGVADLAVCLRSLARQADAIHTLSTRVGQTDLFGETLTLESMLKGVQGSLLRLASGATDLSERIAMASSSNQSTESHK